MSMHFFKRIRSNGIRSNRIVPIGIRPNAISHNGISSNGTRSYEKRSPWVGKKVDGYFGIGVVGSRGFEVGGYEV